MSSPRIVRLAGALAEAGPLPEVSLYELVRVGEDGLLAEVVRTDGDTATLQVFEETSGLRLGEGVEPTGETLAAELGPGLLGGVLDGVGRPLEVLAAETGPFLRPGASGTTLDRERAWDFTAEAGPGDGVAGGDVLGRVEEAPGLAHLVMVPPGLEGTLAEVSSGSYAVDEPLGRLEDGTPLTLLQRWPVRRPRPLLGSRRGERPMVTGQRVLDFLFPVAEGGSVAVPGGFGTGKTVIEQSLARYAAADVVVFVGCGERGNEMAEMLAEFPALEDPGRDRPLMERTVLVVNTSNMPVVAREASVYLGLTIGEYYRDMGHRVAVMADSISRWAEALREMSSRLQEMPGEEGYPTYLGNRLGKLYERAGSGRVPGRPEREGSLTFISAVSPPGGDFSEPVTQASLRVAGALWALDPELAHQRHFPAVDWETSYSLYADRLGGWFARQVDEAWPALRTEVLELLQQDRELREISGLVGPEALEDADRLVLGTARMLREVLLAQSAFDPVDASSPPRKTFRIAFLALSFHRRALAAVEAEDVGFEAIDLGRARRALAAVRSAPEEELEASVREARGVIEEAVPAGREEPARAAPGTEGGSG